MLKAADLKSTLFFFLPIMRSDKKLEIIINHPRKINKIVMSMDLTSVPARLGGVRIEDVGREGRSLSEKSLGKIK